jgi:hypothetical protein
MIEERRKFAKSVGRTAKPDLELAALLHSVLASVITNGFV